MRNLGNDVELENYLREFQPIEPLPLRPARKRVPLMWAAALAVAVLVLATFAIRAPWNMRDLPTLQDQPKTPPAIASAPVNELTLGKLSAAAQQGDQALESELFHSASVALPRMDRPNSALNALSGE